MKQAWAIGIFALVYAIILAGEESPRKLDRPAAGLVGAVLMVLTGVLSRREAFAAIDLGTLVLLFGMMVVVHYATASGLLERLAGRVVAMSKNPIQLLASVCAGAGLLSALFVNDTICLLMTPLVVATIGRKRLPAEPYLLALATSSNIGSVMTLTGNPQNMLVGRTSGWSWAGFVLRMAPIGILCLVINGLIVRWLYRKDLKPTQWSEIESVEAPLDRRLAVKASLVLLGLLIALLAGAPMDLAALTAAVTMIVWANRAPEETFASVDWALLLFFAGLFVVVAGVTKTEGIWISRLIPTVTRQPGTLHELGLFSLGSVVGSNLFSNVPFVLLLREWVAATPHPSLLWLALAASSTFAGNLTLLGSVANLLVAQRAKETCSLSFKSFLRVGSISTVVTVGVSVFALWIYSQLGWA